MAPRPPVANTFPRSHRLKRRRLLRPLFERGRADVGTLAVGSVRLLYRVAGRAEVGEESPVQVGFSAGRAGRRGVARNRIRRLLREVYRVHQHELVDLFSLQPGTLTLMVLYRSTWEAVPSIHADLPEALRRLAARLGSANSGAPRNSPPELG